MPQPQSALAPFLKPPSAENGFQISLQNAFVRKLSAYGQLSDVEIKLLVDAIGPIQRVPPRHDLIREGAKPSSLIVILEGWACRYKILPDGGRQIIAFMMPGDFCDLHVGELEEMDHSIATITGCRITKIPRAQVEAMIISTPALTKAFWRSQLIDGGVLRAWIVGIGRRDAQQRLAHLMLELYVRMRNVGLADDNRCEIPLPQTVLADALGLTPVHINRVLRKLRDEEIMTFRSGTLRILNAGALVRIAGFDDNYLHRKIKDFA